MDAELDPFVKRDPLEQRLAALLAGGTWLASSVIGVGLLLPSEAWIVRAGIGLFIALPIARLVLMLLVYLRRGDLRIGLIAALVLAIVLLGVVFGIRT